MPWPISSVSPLPTVVRLAYFRRGERVSNTLDTLDSFDTQVTYEDGSIPRILYYDEEGPKCLPIESEFWASLLEGKARGHFDNLWDVGSAVSLSKAPTTKLETVWGEVIRQRESTAGRGSPSWTRSTGSVRMPTPRPG